MGFHRKITVCNFRIFSTKLAETRTSLRLHSLRGSPAKAAVRRAFKPKNVATCLTTEVSPLCEFGSPAACARSLRKCCVSVKFGSAARRENQPFLQSEVWIRGRIHRRGTLPPLTYVRPMSAIEKKGILATAILTVQQTVLFGA